MNLDQVHVDRINDAWRRLPPDLANRAAMVGLLSMLRALADGVIVVPADLPEAQDQRIATHLVALSCLVGVCAEHEPLTACEDKWSRPWRGGGDDHVAG